MKQIVPIENLVTLYVWKPHKLTNGDDGEGHAAIQTFGSDGRYISWWPIAYDMASYAGAHRPDPTRTFEKDLAEEGQSPDDIIIFCSLNKAQIHGTFDYLNNERARYHALGEHSLYTSCRLDSVSLHNCTSMAATLLKAGGGACGDFGSGDFLQECLKISRFQTHRWRPISGTITPQVIAEVANRRKMHYEWDLVPQIPGITTNPSAIQCQFFPPPPTTKVQWPSLSFSKA